MNKRKLAVIIALAVVFLAVVSVLTAVLIKNANDKKKAEQTIAFFQKYYDEKLVSYEAENEKYSDYEVDVAFLGDSLTDGYDLEKFYPDLVVANRGIGGDTTVGLEDRLDVSVYDLKPKVAVILIGANNMQTMLDNYEDILAGMKENLPNTEVIILSLTSMSGDWGKNNQLAAYNNVSIKLLCEKYSYAFVDLYSALFDIKTGGIRAEYTTDGGHLTDAGYEVFTNTVRPYVDEALEKFDKSIALNLK